MFPSTVDTSPPPIKTVPTVETVTMPSGSIPNLHAHAVPVTHAPQEPVGDAESTSLDIEAALNSIGTNELPPAQQNPSLTSELPPESTTTTTSPPINEEHVKPVAQVNPMPQAPETTKQEETLPESEGDSRKSVRTVPVQKTSSS